VENPGIAARFTLGPEAVVEKVRHAFTSDKPKLRYPVTLVTHAVALLKRLLPAARWTKLSRAELKRGCRPHVKQNRLKRCLMSVQNIVNITEANLHQTLEQSMNAGAVLFLVCAQPALRAADAGAGEPGRPIQRPVYAGEGGLRRRADAGFTVWPARHPYGLSVPERPAGGRFEGPQPEEAIRALLDKVLPREEELKAQQALALMQEENTPRRCRC
jgi:hypothetical protein